MAGTTWVTFVANTKARAQDVNNNFDWIEGNILPMSAGSETNNSYDLGSDIYRWRDIHIGRYSYHHDHMVLDAGKFLALDSTISSSTYITRSATNTISFVASGTSRMVIDGTKVSIIDHDLHLAYASKIDLSGGNNTEYLVASTNTMDLYLGGGRAVGFGTTVVHFDSANIELDDGYAIVFDVSEDLKMYRSGVNDIAIYVGASRKYFFGDNIFSVDGGGGQIDGNWIPITTNSHNLGDATNYWHTVHYVTGTIHSLTNPNKTNTTAELKKVADFTDKKQFPAEIYVPANTTTAKDGIAANKLLCYILKSIQELDKRLENLGG